MMNFNRIMSTIDVETMQQSNVTVIGGAYGLARDLVHSGLGSVTLVDFDRIDATNPVDEYLWDGGEMPPYADDFPAELLQTINERWDDYFE